MSVSGSNLECGHSLEELSVYVDTGEFSDPGHLTECPECQAGLASLRRLAVLGDELVNADIAAAGSGTDDWMQSILDNLRLELRPGRDIPVRPDTPGDILTETEGSISALIRSAADSLPGTAAGKCRLEGDISTPGSPITVRVDVAVVFGHPLDERAAAVRRGIAATLARHTELNIAAIDVTVADVLEPGFPGPNAGPARPSESPDDARSSDPSQAPKEKP